MPEVVMPRLSDTMEEGEVSRWLKKVGDQIHKGDVLAEIETDKATMDLEAFDEGVLEKLLVTEGTLVPIGQPVAIIGTGNADGAAKIDSSNTEQEPATPTPAAPDAPASDAPEAASPAATASPESSRTASSADVRMSPLARRTAREHHLDLASITGTGPDGRIVRADVEDAVAAAEAHPAAAQDGTRASSPPTASGSAASLRADVATDVEEVAVSNIRRVTARRLTESQSVPHFFLTSVIEADHLTSFRADINERLADSGTKISINDLLVRACAVALRAHPQVNSSWDENRILRHRRINVGVAVSLDDGLIVPVITGADRKSLSEISTETRTLADRARAGKLTPSEFTGGTFTISNLGMFGIDQFTAVINPPEAAILAVGAVVEVPAVRDGQLVNIRKITLTLTVDHRVLDGATAAAFMRDLKAILEEPLRIVI